MYALPSISSSQPSELIRPGSHTNKTVMAFIGEAGSPDREPSRAEDGRAFDGRNEPSDAIPSSLEDSSTELKEPVLQEDLQRCSPSSALVAPSPGFPVSAHAGANPLGSKARLGPVTAPDPADGDLDDKSFRDVLPLTSSRRTLDCTDSVGSSRLDLTVLQTPDDGDEAGQQQPDFADSDKTADAPASSTLPNPNPQQLPDQDPDSRSLRPASSDAYAESDLSVRSTPEPKPELQSAGQSTEAPGSSPQSEMDWTLSPDAFKDPAQDRDSDTRSEASQPQHPLQTRSMPAEGGATPEADECPASRVAGALVESMASTGKDVAEILAEDSAANLMPAFRLQDDVLSDVETASESGWTEERQPAPAPPPAVRDTASAPAVFMVMDEDEDEDEDEGADEATMVTTAALVTVDAADPDQSSAGENEGDPKPPVTDSSQPPVNGVIATSAKNDSKEDTEAPYGGPGGPPEDATPGDGVEAHFAKAVRQKEDLLAAGGATEENGDDTDHPPQDIGGEGDGGSMSYEDENEGHLADEVAPKPRLLPYKNEKTLGSALTGSEGNLASELAVGQDGTAYGDLEAGAAAAAAAPVTLADEVSELEQPLVYPEPHCEEDKEEGKPPVGESEGTLLTPRHARGLEAGTMSGTESEQYSAADQPGEPEEPSPLPDWPLGTDLARAVPKQRSSHTSPLSSPPPQTLKQRVSSGSGSGDPRQASSRQQPPAAAAATPSLASPGAASSRGEAPQEDSQLLPPINGPTPPKPPQPPPQPPQQHPKQRPKQVKPLPPPPPPLPQQTPPPEQSHSQHSQQVLKDVQRQQPQKQQQPKKKKAAASPPAGGEDAEEGSSRPVRLRDVMAASEVPNPESITMQYLKLLHAGALSSRPKTAPETSDGAANKVAAAPRGPAGSGTAAAIALSVPTATTSSSAALSSSTSGPGAAAAAAAAAAGPRPGTGRSSGSSSSSMLTAQGLELARLQARTAWEVSPLGRGGPGSVDNQSVTSSNGGGGAGGSGGGRKLPPLDTSGGGAAVATTVVSPESPSGLGPSTGGRTSPTRQVLAASLMVPAESREDAPPPPRVFIPRPAASAAPYTKMYTPGPGAYTPSVSRSGDRSYVGGPAFGGVSPPRAWGFGSTRQRPPHVCLHFPNDSPGPRYLPSKDRLSTSPTLKNTKFDHNLPGGRFSLTAGQPCNAPMFNPGPGSYEPATTSAGDPLSPGATGAQPAFSFAHTRKLMIPAMDGAALPVISREHAREYFGTLSPGPAHYSPDTSPIRTAAPSYSVPGRAPCWFDPVELSPGPVYKPNELDRRGGHSLGDAPYATIGNGPKFHDPTNALSASAWLSFNHARRANYGVHSPGPVYFPHDPRVPHVPSPLLATGGKDRFTLRNEAGRLQ